MSSRQTAKPTSNSGEIYDAFAPQYRDYSKQKNAYITAVDKLIIDTFGGAVGSLFDFGSGDGVRSGNLAKQLGCRRLVQGDISTEMLEYCRKLNAADEVWNLKDDWRQRGETFDLITCLWNVLGHVPNREERLLVLANLRQSLKPKGRICFDVNNRHNRIYGRLRVLFRRLIDWISPDDHRGDAHFEWEINGRVYPAYGHLFTFAEVSELLHTAGLKIESWRSVNYTSGETSDSVDKGHLFFIVSARST